jgi:hypothetical protein
MRLDRLRDEVRHELGQTGATSTVDDAAIDHALSQSLTLLAPYYPAVRAELTLEAAGKTQNLKLLTPNMARLDEVWCPYDAANPMQVGYTNVIIDAHTVYFRDVEPQAGEKLEAVYHARHTLAGLYQDEADSLPEDAVYEHPLVLATVAHLLSLEALRLMLSLDPAKSKLGHTMRGLGDSLTTQAIDEAISLAGAVRNPVWSEIGL